MGSIAAIMTIASLIAFLLFRVSIGDASQNERWPVIIKIKELYKKNVD